MVTLKQILRGTWGQVNSMNQNKNWIGVVWISHFFLRRFLFNYFPFWNCISILLIFRYLRLVIHNHQNQMAKTCGKQMDGNKVIFRAGRLHEGTWKTCLPTGILEPQHSLPSPRWDTNHLSFSHLLVKKSSLLRKCLRQHEVLFAAIEYSNNHGKDASLFLQNIIEEDSGSTE